MATCCPVDRRSISWGRPVIVHDPTTAAFDGPSSVLGPEPERVASGRDRQHLYQLVVRLDGEMKGEYDGVMLGVMLGVVLGVVLMDDFGSLTSESGRGTACVSTVQHG